MPNLHDLQQNEPTKGSRNVANSVMGPSINGLVQSTSMDYMDAKEYDEDESPVASANFKIKVHKTKRK